MSGKGRKAEQQKQVKRDAVLREVRPDVAAVSDSGRARQGAASAAPRPHWVTTTAAVISLFVSAVALLYSRASSETAARSLEISQRAYLQISNGEVTIEAGQMIDAFRDVKRAVDVPFDMFEASVTIAFDIENSGNTPAQITSATLDFDNAPGWLMADYLNKEGFAGRRLGVQSLSLPPVGTLGPKSRVHREHRYPVTVLKAAAMEYLYPYADRVTTPFGVVGPLRILARVEFTDDFNRGRSMQWCWHSNRRSKWALQCQPGETTPFKRQPSLFEEAPAGPVR